MRVAYCIIAVGVLLSMAKAAEKTRDWQTGTVLDSQRASVYHGTINTGTAATPVYAEYANFAIEGKMHTYYAQERLRALKFNRPANLTISAPVKFAVEKRWLYVLDNDGKEHRMVITRDTATPQQAVVQPPAPPPSLGQRQYIAGLTTAASAGDADAQYNLGILYTSGDGVPRDDGEAVKLYQKAAAQGNGSAQYMLGLACAQGRGVPQDFILAHMWFNLAASRSRDEDREQRTHARDIIETKLTPQQLGEAQRLAREWKPKKETP